MKYCPECATAVEPEDKYCPVCGTKLARFRVGEAACEACGSLLVKIGKQIRCPRCDSYCIECGTLITKKNLKCPECKVSFKKFPKKRSLAKLPAEGHPLYKNPTMVEYAGFFLRFLALAADVIIIGALVSIIGVLLNVRFTFLPFWGFVMAVLILYNALLTGLVGGTLGMKLYSMRVVNLKGGKVGVVMGGLRFLFGLVSILTLVGVFMIGFHKYKQALHDVVLKTFVIRVKD